MVTSESRQGSIEYYSDRCVRSKREFEAKVHVRKRQNIVFINKILKRYTYIYVYTVVFVFILCNIFVKYYIFFFGTWTEFI